MGFRNYEEVHVMDVQTILDLVCTLDNEVDFSLISRGSKKYLVNI